MKKILLTSALVCSFAMGFASSYHMESPNGDITAELSDDGTTLTVYHGPKSLKALEITDMALQIDGKEIALAPLANFKKAGMVYHDYHLLSGKKSHYTNSGNEYTLTFGDNRVLTVRVYNDGIAYRITVDGLDNSAVTDEYSTYVIPEGTTRWIQQLTEPYEDFFPCTTTGVGEKQQWGYPALVQYTPGVFALISEADIQRGHSASYLDNSDDVTRYKVTMGENKLTYNGSFTTPWRVAIIGDLGDIVESSLITDLSPESTIEDTSWIHPGSVSWVYWAYNHGSNDYQIVKKYVDLADKMQWPYILIDAEWDEMGNGGTIEDAVAYAKSKGVKPLIWYNSSTAWVNYGAPTPYYRLNKPEDREKEYKWLEDLGVAGVKIDFFAGDKQETMDYCIDLLEDAAKHHLMVNFHGATIPRGWQRTYPNLMSVEAVYGAEWYNNLPVLTNRAAYHNTTLPFTRNVIGPMDYTPCTFSDSQHPHITTNAHELALPVLFESTLLHWADRPESYLAQPEAVRAMMTELPTVWDETKFIAGYPGLYCVLARRSGDGWWIAGINGTEEEMPLDLDLSTLNLGDNLNVTLFEDGKNGRPWMISKLGSFDGKVTLQPRGGIVAVIK